MTKAASLTLLADRLQRASYDLVRYYTICDRVCMEQIGVTASQGYTLLALPPADSISMNDLSLAMKLAISTMTRMVDQLVLKHMVEREPDPEDRRVVRVRLTQQGVEAQAKLKETLRDVFSQVVQGLPAGEQESIVHGLETLNQSIVMALKACCDPETVE
jgi:DNA-binding MarR family transcriptional regulator